MNSIILFARSDQFLAFFQPKNVIFRNQLVEIRYTTRAPTPQAGKDFKHMPDVGKTTVLVPIAHP